jgi:hypothetical protein
MSSDRRIHLSRQELRPNNALGTRIDSRLPPPYHCTRVRSRGIKWIDEMGLLFRAPCISQVYVSFMAGLRSLGSTPDPGNRRFLLRCDYFSNRECTEAVYHRRSLRMTGRSRRVEKLMIMRVSLSRTQTILVPVIVLLGAVTAAQTTKQLTYNIGPRPNISITNHYGSITVVLDAAHHCKPVADPADLPRGHAASCQ